MTTCPGRASIGRSIPHQDNGDTRSACSGVFLSPEPIVAAASLFTCHGRTVPASARWMTGTAFCEIAGMQRARLMMSASTSLAIVTDAKHQRTVCILKLFFWHAAD